MIIIKNIKEPSFIKEIDMWILDELKSRKRDTSNLALIYKDKQISYNNLWNASEKIACWLERNLSTDAPVLIYGNKDIEIIEIMIASLKTGRPYVPIDITFPLDRVKKIAKITDAEILFDLSGKEGVEEEFKLKKIINKKLIKNIVMNTNFEKEIDESKWGVFW